MGLVQLPLFFSAIHVGKCNTPWEVQDPMKNGLEVEVDPCKLAGGSNIFYFHLYLEMIQFD